MDRLDEHADRDAARYALRAVDAAFAHDTTTPTVWPRCEQLFAHALALADTMAPAACQGAATIALLNRVTDYLYYSQGGHRSITTCERVANDARLMLGDEHPPHA